MFHDRILKIKAKSLEAMITLTSVPCYARAIAETGLCQKLVTEHLHSEETPDKVVLLVLDIIHNLLFVNYGNFGDKVEEEAEVGGEEGEKQPTQDDYDMEALLAFKRYINHTENSSIQERACTVLHDLCANSQVAKKSASEDDEIIDTLCELLKHDSKPVRIAACQALATICITTAGKLKATKKDVVTSLLSLVDEAIACSTPDELDNCTEESELQNDSLRLYAIRATEIISEVPSARNIFCKVSNVEKIKLLANNNRLSSDVRRAAQETITVIQWKP